MFRNNSGKNFQDVTTSGGFGHLQKGHGLAIGDIENDGPEDVFAKMGVPVGSSLAVRAISLATMQHSN